MEPLAMHVLIIEDNRDLAENIGLFLENGNFHAELATDGASGLRLALANNYDVIILDLMLPDMDGIEVCRKLRAQARNHTPTLMLTARDTLDDKLQGFAVGADDYLVKPFALHELQARLLALARRKKPENGGQLRVADLEYDTDTLIIKRAGKTIALKPTTRKILALLMRESHRVVSRAEIEAEVWTNQPPEGDSLRVHIYNIRAVIDKPFPVKLLRTIHGAGYRLAPPDESEA